MLAAGHASTLIVTTDPKHVSAIEKLAGEFSFFVANIGTTGGPKLEISVDRQPFISAPLTALSKPWAESLQATLHDEVMA